MLQPVAFNPPASCAQSENLSRRHLFGRVAVLVLCAVSAYLPAIHGDYIFDDLKHVLNDKKVQNPNGLPDIWFHVTENYQHQYYPLTSTVFWIQRRLWGTNRLGHHLVNLALHILNALLFWRLLCLLQIPGAYLGGLLFVLHPMHVQSVAWIVELKNVLSGFFFLASGLVFLRFFLKDQSAHWWRYAGAVGLFVLALLSKAAAGSLPVGLMLILLWKRPKQWKRACLYLAPFLLLAMGMTFLTKFLEEHYSSSHLSLGLDLSDRLVLLGQTCWFYACKLAYPGDLRFMYAPWALRASSWLGWVDLTCMVLVLAVLWLTRRKMGMGPLVGTLFFLLAVGPLVFADVAYMRFSYVANHWVYWASMGLLPIPGALLYRLKISPRWIRVIGVGLCVVLWGRTWNHAHLYQSREVIWRHVLEAYPTCEVGLNNLANELRKSHPAQAKAYYIQAMRHHPTTSSSFFGLGTLYLEQQQTSPAKFYLYQALFLGQYENSTRIQTISHFQLARIYMADGALDQASQHLQRLLKFDPGHLGAITMLAHINLVRKRLAQADQLITRAKKIDPDSALTLEVQGMSEARHHQYAAAREHLSRAIQLNDTLTDAMLNLGIVLHRQGDLSGAEQYYRKVLLTRPGSAGAHEKLGMVLYAQRQWAEAEKHFQQAVTLDPTRHLAALRAAQCLAHQQKLNQAEEAIRILLQSRSSWLEAQNELAWLMAIQGNSHALPLAQEIAKQTRYQIVVVLDTLAAALAGTGQFDRAIAWMQKALDQMPDSGNLPLKRGMIKRLAAYRQHQPWRQYERSSPPNPKK